MSKKVRYFFEGTLLRVTYAFFKYLPLNTAAAISGFLARSIGPYLKASRVAQTNMQMALPDWSQDTITQTTRSMWENLGRIFPEYIHYNTFQKEKDRLSIEGEEILQRFHQEGRPILFAGAHFGHIQMISLALQRLNMTNWQFLRSFSNPHTNALLKTVLQPFVDGLIFKSASSYKDLLRTLKQGNNVCILFDHYMHRGVPVPFFNRPARTSPVLVRLSRKLNIPIIPFHVERRPHSCFRIIFEKPVDPHLDEEETLTFLNQRLEAWIRDNPSQWFWVHDRWKETV